MKEKRQAAGVKIERMAASCLPLFQLHTKASSMTIQEIKSNLPIETVLSSYGLKANSNKMLNCPFHSDKKASMKIYPETNTVYCFAGSCEANNLDTIDFIMEMDKSNKHEAITKAKGMIGHSKPTTDKKKTMAWEQKPMPVAADGIVDYQKAIRENVKVRQYCLSRGLDWDSLGIGYKTLRTGGKWGRGCIIFGLKNAEGKVVSLYGRSTKSSGHYYQQNRQGLYPAYPDTSTKTLIIAESVIDTATLQQVPLGLENYSLLAAYGTNGLTKEHFAAIATLNDLTELIFAFDGDEAGRNSAWNYAESLKKQYPKLTISRIDLPNGEDINSMAVAHDDKQGLFKNLLDNRIPFALKEETVVETVERISMASQYALDTQQAHNLKFTTANARYEVKGGIRYSDKDLDSLRVTLVIINEKGKKSRCKPDLYEDKQLLKSAAWISEQLGLRSDLVTMDLHALTDALESYRNDCYRAEKQGQGAPVRVTVPAAMRKECTSFLKKKKLLTRLDEQLQQCGLIGEENNRKLGFCIVSSYAMPQPLHGLIGGTSGSGKTWLLSTLCALVPPEYYIPITRATDNSFYNYQPYDLKNKLISVEDKDAMSEEANLAFRELQTKGMVSTSTTGQDKEGNSRSFVKQVFGPIASMSCTTKGELYLDDMNRCFLLAVDESSAQTARILDYQKRAAAGLVDTTKGQSVKYFIQHCLRLLRPMPVIIPYATRIHLPDSVKDKRRLNSLYLALVGQITLLHQYQRKQDKNNRLISTLEDLQLANEIMFDAIVLKADELHGSLRSFYERLKKWLEKTAGEQAKQYEFRQRELRQAFRLSKTAVANYLRELVELEYVQIAGGSERRGWQYKVQYWDDNEQLRLQIKTFLKQQIEHLEQNNKVMSEH